MPFAKGYAANTAFGYQFPLVSCGATYAPKKVWGFADVAADGSACFHVPTDVPIYFLALDAKGRAVQRMRTFTHFMPGEVQGCVGCHADRNYATRQSRAGAWRLPGRPQKLRPPDWGVKGFSYAEVVQPVLDRHCVECHNAARAPQGVDLSGDKTDFFNVSYDVLARKGTLGERQPGVPQRGASTAAPRAAARTPVGSRPSTAPTTTSCMVTPKTWGSPASQLADLILNGHPDAKGKPRVKLEPADTRRIVFLWIDLNVPYYPTSVADYPATMGCRRVLPEELDAELARVAAGALCQLPRAGRAADVLHADHEPGAEQLPAGAAGQVGRRQRSCGRAVFASTDDPDYRALLKTFQPVQAVPAGAPALPTSPAAPDRVWPAIPEP